MRHAIAGLGLLASLALAPTAGEAQDAGCTWDRCALRLQSRFFGSSLVRGAEQAKVAGLGFFPPRIPLLEQGSDSVRVHYEAFRSAQRTAGWLNLTGLTLTVASTIVFLADNDAVGASTALTIVGFGFGFAGAGVGSRARDRLSQAAWHYNRGLPRER